MTPAFHPLTISHIDRLGDLAIAVRFAVPDDLADAFRFTPGQYLTLRTDIGGQDVRRPYSICTAPFEGDIGVGIKYVDDGLFSGHAVANFAVGDKVQVMTPQADLPITPPRRQRMITFCFWQQDLGSPRFYQLHAQFLQPGQGRRSRLFMATATRRRSCSEPLLKT